MALSVATLGTGSDFSRMATALRGVSKNVFVNCPFGEKYRSLLRPLLFAIVSFGSSLGLPR